MISCRDANHLFGRYLDGKLSPSLQTELHAHRLQCTQCQNELALYEAVGDVIAIDRREPTVSASFTDRVLLARRAQMRPVRRNWARTILIFGSPMAAAASIALMLSVMRPVAPTRTAVLTYQVAAPKAIQEQLKTGTLSAAAQRELNATPEMSTAGFLELWLAPVVEKSKNAAEGARVGADRIFEAFRETLSTTNDSLMAQYRLQQAPAAETVGPPAPGEAAPAEGSLAPLSEQGDHPLW
jgi:hypothetical protein